MIKNITAFATIAAATLLTSGMAQAGCKVVKYTSGW